MKKLNKPKALGRKVIIKYLDTVFSLYIRHKNSKNGYCTCYTCGKQLEIKHIQNGHFFSRSHYGLRWAEINCKPQCYVCNVLLNGNYPIYSIKLSEEIGLEQIKEMEKSKDRKFMLYDLKETLIFWVYKLQEMKVEIPAVILNAIKKGLI
jgi:hypothetical protein